MPPDLTISNVEARIVPRVTAGGRPFAEILHTWSESGQPRFACSRVWWALADTPHARAAEVASFVKRRGQAELFRQ